MSRGDHIKLLGEPEQPPQPTFPHTNIQIGPNGVVLNIMLADDIGIVKVFKEADMNELCKRWLETRQQVKQQLDVIQRVQNSKL